MEYVSLGIAILSVIVAVIVGCGQIHIARKMDEFEKRQDKRDEKRRYDEIYAEATRFIQKYNKNDHNAEIYLLPLCVAAYKYNPVYPYHREMYREYCSLTEDIQNMILERSNLSLSCNKAADYYNNLLKAYEKVQNSYCVGDTNIFYDNGKYFERALLHHGAKTIPKLECDIDDEQKRINESPLLKASKTVIQSTMDFHDHITNELAYNATNKPIEGLFAEHTNMGSAQDGEEIIASYLCCVVAKYVSVYASKDNNKKENVGCPEDYQGVRFMEDMFLDALHSMEIYNT